MGLIILIIAGIVIYYLFTRMKNNSSGSSFNYTSSENSSTYSSPSEKPAKGGTVHAICSSLPFCDARFEDGTVYCRQSNGTEFVAGYYELAASGESCKALCTFDKAEIANITPDGSSSTRVSIYLTRMGLYNRFMKQGGYVKYPGNSIWECALAQYGNIEDAETHAAIASYSGNTYEAAAAFACLCYEALEDTRYNQYYSRENW